MAYQSVEEIDRHYATLTQQAGDDAERVSALRLERADAVVEFRLAGVQARERQVWQQAAFTEYPLTRDFPELVTGETEEAVKAAAKSLQDRLSKIQGDHGQPPAGQSQDDLRQQARGAYGPLAGGGNGQPAQYTPEEERFLADFQERFNAGKGTPNFPTMAEVERFVKVRGSNHIGDRVKYWAQQTRSSGVA